MIKQLLYLSLLSAAAVGCSAQAETTYRELYTTIESEAFPEPDAQGNIIPDFSRVGYMWGDKQIPTLPVVKTVQPLAAGQDATKMLQAAIDEVSALDESKRGAILLAKGEYIVSEPLTIKASGVVIRGEGSDSLPESNTVVYYTAKQKSNLFTFGGRQAITFVRPQSTNVKDTYVPVGRFWVRVDNAQDFSVKQEVVLCFDPNEQWIKDIKMDQIAPREDGKPIHQWDSESYNTTGERIVTKISGDTLWFENPVVMPLDTKYGFISVAKVDSNTRISGVGIEDLFVKSYYSGDVDEAHGWAAITMMAVEHSWIKNVKGKNFGFGLALLNGRSKCITVTGCSHIEPKSIITGGRRYTYANGGQLNLVINCSSEGARHAYNSSPKNVGPNANVNCTGLHNFADDGPHHRWNQGTLYDNIISDGHFNVQDRGSYGSGHGWAGIENVLWNCEYDFVAVQSPWVSGKNYSIGTVGEKVTGRFTDRPDGVWVSHGKHVSPSSLYHAQLELRNKLQPGGVFDVD